MKKLFLLIIGLTAFSCAASAQATKYTSVIAKDVTLNINNTLPCPVANVNLWYSLAAVHINSTTVAFCLIDQSGFTNTPLPVTPVLPPVITVNAAICTFGSTITNFTVNDLTISNNCAFFCGTLNAGSQSFYGYFNLNDFGMSLGGGSIGGTTLTVNINCLASYTTAAPAILNKLVAYKDGTQFKVVAIGSEGLVSIKSTNKIVEIFDATGTPTCKVADMPIYNVSGQIKNVYLNDIVLTNNYVVITGIDRGALAVCNSLASTDYPWISFGKRSNVIGDICNPSINPNFFLPVPWEANETVIAESLTNDKIAISYLHPIGNPAASTRFRIIDIPSHANTNSQHVDLDSKLTPLDMNFMIDIGKVEILQPISANSDFLQLDISATTNYTTTVLVPNNKKFKSIKTISYAYGNYISIHNAEVYIQDRTANLPHSTATCPNDYSLNVKIVDNLPLDQSMCYIIQGENVLSPLLSSPFTFNISSYIPLNTQCFSYE